MNQSKNMVSIAYAALDEKLAEEISVIDISGVTVLADYFLIASGSNVIQVQTLADHVLEKMEKAGYHCKQIEGYQTANWILLDFADVVIHIFSREDRRFYDLERIWRDGIFVDWKELPKSRAES